MVAVRPGGSVLRRACLAFVVGALATSCSALGLTDDLEQMQGCGMDCSELDAFDPPPPCMSWECNDRAEPGLGFCELDLLDADDDGSPAPECATDERAPDCDDTDRRNAPLLTETCDGQDNDCDGAVDEETSFESAVLAEGRFTGVSWAQTETEVVGAVFDDRTFLNIVSAGSARVVSSQMRPNPRSVLGAAGSDVAVGVLQSLCPSYVAGAWVPGDAMVSVDPAHAMTGVATPIACTDAGSRVSSAAIVGRGSEVFVTGYVHGDGGVEACGETVGGTAAVAVLRRGPGEGPVAAGVSTTVGPHRGLGDPALLNLGPMGVLFGIVGASSIELYRLTLDFSAAAPVQVALALELPCEGTCGHISLARGGDEPGLVGVAYRAGPCAEADVRFARVRVDTETVRLVDASPWPLASGDVRRVSVAGRSVAPRWAVAWADGQRLRARRIGAEPVGEVLEVRTSAGFFVEPIQLTYDAAELTVHAYDANAERLVADRARCL